MAIKPTPARVRSGTSATLRADCCDQMASAGGTPNLLFSLDTREVYKSVRRVVRTRKSTPRRRHHASAILARSSTRTRRRRRFRHFRDGPSEFVRVVRFVAPSSPPMSQVPRGLGRHRGTEPNGGATSFDGGPEDGSPPIRARTARRPVSVRDAPWRVPSMVRMDVEASQRPSTSRSCSRRPRKRSPYYD